MMLLQMEVTSVSLILYSCLMILWTSVDACSEPLGWKVKTLPELVESAELIIYGEFLDVTNSTNAENPEVTDVRIHTAVYCVLKNEHEVDVPATLIIEDYKSEFDGRCVNNLYNIKTAVMLIVFIGKREGSNNFEFENYNVQSAKWEVDDDLLDEVIQTCAVINATEPIGASPSAEHSCPHMELTEDACERTGDGTKISYTLSLLITSTLIALITLHFSA